MQTVDMILSGGTLITMDDEYRVIADGAIAIAGEKIAALGPRADILAQYSAQEVIDCQGHYVLPGLINAHTHVPMTLLRGLADDLRLDVWLMGYVMPVEREFVSPQFCRLGTLLACAEMIRSGVTSFCDMYYFEAEIAKATAEVGLRAVLCETVLKFQAPDAETYEDSLALAEAFIQEWQPHPLITPTVGPHAPYSNTQETLRRCRELALKYDRPLMIHIAETEREVEDNMRDYGKTVVPWVKDTGLFDVRGVIAAHCVHVDEHEMRIMAKYGVSVAHCPSANLKLASGIAPVAQMLELGVNVAIGTDGPASNNDLDMFEEMRLAALLAKVRPIDPTAVAARQALTMATRNGAKALRLDAVTGSLEVGKLADVIVVDTRGSHNSPHFDFNPNAVYSQLVYATKSSDVRHTICHGKLLMRDRQLLTVDEDAVKAEAERYAAEVGRFLRVREGDPLSKLVAVSLGVERAESFEIQIKARLDNPDRVEELLSHSDVEVIRAVHYRQYDTYFVFTEPEPSWVRYREDDKINAKGEVESVRMRLTYTIREQERRLEDVILLSHSRYIAPATQPLRFYREYFQAPIERSLQKERRRWRLLYKGVLFFLNVDRLIEPAADGMFIEVKSRTWSLTDAQNKAYYVREMLDILGIDMAEAVSEGYLEMTQPS
ncbi:MAG: amidohydrolase [Anaerolineae bacterium]|nr:amidohydrolase [Anaerolineae bacterium]MDW8170961.1 amidohydrolase [Anaerolineae bacterium]